MILFMLIPAIILFKVGTNVYAEWTDNDSRVMQVVDKKPGITTWTTNEGTTKAPRNVNHSAAAEWVKMKRYDGYVCTFPVTNPYTAEAYKVGEYFHMDSVSQCSDDPSPNGVYALGWMFLGLLYWGILALIFDGR